MKKGELNKGGFTIIEVVLVLAVAGLIFIMVFVALPALQRSQRDNDRRDDMMDFIGKVKQSQTNNRGALPKGAPVDVTAASGGNANEWGGFYRDYLGNRFMDPDGEAYKLKVVECYSSKATDGSPCADDVVEMLSVVKNGKFPYENYSLLVVTKAKCNGTEIVASNNPRNLAVTYRLEGAGSFCDAT